MSARAQHAAIVAKEAALRDEIEELTARLQAKRHKKKPPQQQQPAEAHPPGSIDAMAGRLERLVNLIGAAEAQLDRRDERMAAAQAAGSPMPSAIDVSDALGESTASRPLNMHAMSPGMRDIMREIAEREAASSSDDDDDDDDEPAPTMKAPLPAATARVPAADGASRQAVQSVPASTRQHAAAMQSGRARLLRHLLQRYFHKHAPDAAYKVNIIIIHMT